MSKKFTIAVDAEGNVTGTTEDQSVLQMGIDAASVPLGITAEENEVVSKKVAATAAIGYGVSMFFVGEAYGHKRAGEGKQSFIPAFRG